MIAQHARRRRHSPRADLFYGYDYNPAWPSILSIAHNEIDGGQLFVITDRPCVLVPPGLPLPLSVSGGPVVIGAQQVLPVKFKIQLNTAVAPGATWEWGTGPCDLIDPVTNHAPNAAGGTCADVPGPFFPPEPAVVIAASVPGGIGVDVFLQFDRPLVLIGPPPYPIDGQIQVNDGNPVSVGLVAPDTLQMTFENEVGAGATWNVNATPAWCATPLQVSSGTVV